MKKILSKIKLIYYYIISSIGFFPTLISVLFAALAILMVYLETKGISEGLHDRFPFLIITSGETAHTILNSIATGIISLIVFSFTMVMLVLNQAGSNFSPRVIPGLISHQSNQKILGIYLGTLIYSLIIMVNIRSESYYEELPGIAVFLSMAFTFVCLGCFVYFIHSISQSIQIDHILAGIHRITKKKLEQLIRQDKHLLVTKAFEEATWVELNSPRSGYVQSIDLESVLALCYKYDVVMEFLQPLGNYVLEATPFVRINRPVAELEEFCKELAAHVNYGQGELPDLNYLYGFKQITESAVKALSPSVNDPGTAMKAIDYLSELFALRMKLTDEQLVADKEKVVRIRFKQETFDHLFSLCLSSIRNYGKHDSLVMSRLLYMFKNLLYITIHFIHRRQILYKEALLLVHASRKSLSDPGDKEMINRHLKEINAMKVLAKDLPLLSLTD
ncbi:DUF2254 domain-containing protein [Pontibacter sp. SGAir0037]|uniref:DUF2254 domain-containing protein n=1 Tax=Pontibacter sp. SGAir0037 TaxID=2571030 RepID=UPI0010CCCE40|nr:DUF2254 domain-containing protein [Pontibacter sp. SGAir0037]QCR22202.1 DUF2254 domain-containing protein [Pontibacter sp. SGAir0037]